VRPNAKTCVPPNRLAPVLSYNTCEFYVVTCKTIGYLSDRAKIQSSLSRQSEDMVAAILDCCVDVPFKSRLLLLPPPPSQQPSTKQRTNVPSYVSCRPASSVQLPAPVERLALRQRSKISISSTISKTQNIFHSVSYRYISCVASLCRYGEKVKLDMSPWLLGCHFPSLSQPLSSGEYRAARDLPVGILTRHSQFCCQRTVATGQFERTQHSGRRRGCDWFADGLGVAATSSQCSD
jgi:hypothetical protein